MKKTTVEVSCDICGKVSDKCENISYPVLFLTEQTEGRSCEPYISNEKFDVCPDCMKKIIKVSAIGAMGYNNYHIINS